MSLFESLMNIMKEVESTDDLVDGFTMEPIKNGYKILYKKEHVANISFVNKDDNTDRDMETAQDDPNNYNVYITEVKQEKIIKQYIRKLSDLGFENISQD